MLVRVVLRDVIEKQFERRSYRIWSSHLLHRDDYRFLFGGRGSRGDDSGGGWWGGDSSDSGSLLV